MLLTTSRDGHVTSCDILTRMLRVARHSSCRWTGSQQPRLMACLSQSDGRSNASAATEEDEERQVMKP
ncbi:hypothetical protein E2C01_100873 [Portunus trituberculatus]|uniref:Uncharacterized protein n=1 Tax=Portunus trituberculatus TaxID=210409 RepID=A0A5B7K956_PORTR|nr:hypothetical protein [Portunus trituberculatus]